MRIELVARMKKAQNWLFLCIHRNFGDWNTFPLENCREISKKDILHLF